jgi:hypothetical protein
MGGVAAFSSKADTGSLEQSALKQKPEHGSVQSEREML